MREPKPKRETPRRRTQPKTEAAPEPDQERPEQEDNEARAKIVARLRKLHPMD